MQLRVVTDQPWDVKTDVLVIPVAAAPAFEGPLDELDRRAGGELRALASFRELSGKRFSTSLASAGELPAGRLLVVGMGDPATLDREAVVRVAATAERRLGGRTVRSMAVWLPPLADADGLDTAIGVLGVERGLALVERDHEAAALIILRKAGTTRVEVSRRLRELVKRQPPVEAARPR